MSAGTDRWRIYGLALHEAGRALRDGARRMLGIGAVRKRVPERLLIVPPDLRTSDATIANDIYAGSFVFGGRAVTTGGRSPFGLTPPSRHWAEILYGFGWLRHLRAADTALARANARALVGEFLARQPDATARATEVTARRVIAFLSQSPLILDGADHAFYHKLMRALGRDLRRLQRAMASQPRPLARLQAAVAVTYAGLSLEGFEGIARRASRILARELDAQILPDGGHVGRNPKTVLELLLDLLPLKQVYLARGIEPPAELLQALDRIPPLLRLMRHGDGTLALFNGMGSTPVDHLTTLLFYDEARGSPLQRALVSGFERIAARDALLIADTGAAPPPVHAAEAGAGPGAFEFSVRGQRMIVNCGAPRGRDDPIAMLARSTAAHSTLGLADTACAQFLTESGWFGRRLVARWLIRRLGPVMLRGPQNVSVERPSPLRLRMHHDGYAAAFGVTHERRLTLAPEGDVLEGEDRLEGTFAGTPDARAEIRFHLHPAIRASLAQGGRIAMLVLPDGEAWQVRAPGLTFTLEESIFLAATDGARKSEQLVLRFPAAGAAPVQWRFERLTGAR
ncbi:MAG: heparinase II/III family protein [Salinarimonas sp.]|nr:heparinase II/III family protein [Salinarimonas sp.]